MSDNKDRDVSRSNEYPKGEVNTPCFDSKVHIFWGPGQLTGDTYEPPDPKRWRKDPINIPQVVRFIHASKETYNSDGYPDETPTPQEFVWRVEFYEQRVPPNAHLWHVHWRLHIDGVPLLGSTGLHIQVLNYSGIQLQSWPYPIGLGVMMFAPYSFPVVAMIDFVDNGSFPATYAPTGEYKLTHIGNGSLITITPV